MASTYGIHLLSIELVFVDMVPINQLQSSEYASPTGQFASLSVQVFDAPSRSLSVGAMSCTAVERPADDQDGVDSHHHAQRADA